MGDLKGIIKGSYVIGEIVIQAMKYQIFFFLFVLRGGILFGLFPSIAAVSQGIYQQIIEEESISLKKFSTHYKQYFKIGNQLGYTVCGVLVFLWIDLRISATYIQLPILHYFLLFLFILFMGGSLYIFPSLCRYELTYRQYIQRSGLLVFCNLIETIAIIFGLYLSTILMAFFPILLVVASVALYGFPIVWFGIQAMKRAERKAAKL